MDSQQVGRLSGALGGTLHASPSRSPSLPSLPARELQAVQVAAQAFVARGPAALMVEVCRLLREWLEAEEADPAHLAQLTAALESFIRLGQPLEPVVAIAVQLKQQRDSLQQAVSNCYDTLQAKAAECDAKLAAMEAAAARLTSEKAALSKKKEALAKERDDLKVKLERAREERNKHARARSRLEAELKQKRTTGGRL